MGELRGLLASYKSREPMDPAVQSRILLETSRAEARIAVFAILLSLGFGFFLNFTGRSFQTLAIYALIVVVPFLLDSALRRMAAKKLNE